MEKNVCMEGANATAVQSPINESEARRANSNVKVLKRESGTAWEIESVPKAETKRVAAYCRVSTDKEQQESSLQVQTESFRSQIEAHPGWELVGIYADEGITGTQAKHRDAFNRMIADCEAGKIDYIITKSISRFARNTLECLTYIRQLKGYGVYVLFEKERLDTGSEASEMVLSILAAIAQEESRNISENIKWNQRKRYEEGRAIWKETYGYKKEGDREFIVDEKTAPVVRRIFYDYIHGKKTAEIARELEAEGIPGSKGNHWKYASVDFMLTNEKYCGDAQCQKSYVENHLNHRRRRNDQTVVPGYYIRDHHMPIVGREVFDMAQIIRSLRSRRWRPVQYPYGGRIVCPVCGRKLERVVLERTGSPGAWHCPPEKGNTACAGYYVLEEYIDAALRQAYAKLDAELLRKPNEAAAEALRMKKEMPELGEIHYIFLDKTVDEITFENWETMVVKWKCGIESRVHIDYKKPCDFPNSKEQLGTLVSKRWTEKAEEADRE